MDVVWVEKNKTLAEFVQDLRSGIALRVTPETANTIIEYIEFFNLFKVSKTEKEGKVIIEKI